MKMNKTTVFFPILVQEMPEFRENKKGEKQCKQYNQAIF